MFPIWEQFKEVHEWRGYDRQNNLPNLLTINTIANWSIAVGEKVTPFELKVFLKLEGSFWEAMTPKGSVAAGAKEIKEHMAIELDIQPKVKKK